MTYAETMKISRKLASEQKQPPRGVLKKRCCENMLQIYRTTPMRKNNVAKNNTLHLKTDQSYQTNSKFFKSAYIWKLFWKSPSPQIKTLKQRKNPLIEPEIQTFCKRGVIKTIQKQLSGDVLQNRCFKVFAKLKGKRLSHRCYKNHRYCVE